MSENKNVTKSFIDVINAGGFEKGQMQAVVAKDSDWLVEKLKGIRTIEQKLLSIKHLPISPPNLDFDGDKIEWVRVALRIKGLLKRKCKKGARKHYSKK